MSEFVFVSNTVGGGRLNLLAWTAPDKVASKVERRLSLHAGGGVGMLQLGGCRPVVVA